MNAVRSLHLLGAVVSGPLSHLWAHMSCIQFLLFPFCYFLVDLIYFLREEGVRGLLVRAARDEAVLTPTPASSPESCSSASRCHLL